MREIKFRAWDISGNQFWDDSLGDWKIELIDGKKPQLIVLQEWYSPYGEQEFYWRDVEDVVFQQFTGLKDKNGKEIYEGDIVEGEATTINAGFTYKGIVVFYSQNDVHGWYVEDSEGGAWEIKKLSTRISMDNITGEVIGNIYENPELLEE